MKLHGLIYICPECREVVMFSPDSNGHLHLYPLVCAEDGYMMKCIKVDSMLVDQLLKGADINATGETPRA